MKLNDKDFLKNYRKHYNKIKNYITDNCNLASMKLFECLDPQNLQNRDSIMQFQQLVNLLPNTDSMIPSEAVNEYQLLVDENININDYDRTQIDKFWFSVLTEETRNYKNLSFVIFNLLIICHGQAMWKDNFPYPAST